jgi:hypothetical protein
MLRTTAARGPRDDRIDGVLGEETGARRALRTAWANAALRPLQTLGTLRAVHVLPGSRHVSPIELELTFDIDELGRMA